METNDQYIPALRYHWLTPLYDPILHRFMREDIFKKRLINQARLTAGMRVLDLGCGTGTLTMMIKRMYPNVEVVGLDGDPAILEIARKKVTQAGLDITLDQGMAYELPYPDDNFDRVVSSMVMHHLTKVNKARTMKEILRVLRPEGEFHIVDFGIPANIYARMTAMVMQNFEDVDDNIHGRIEMYMRSAGFPLVKEMGHADTLAGTLAFYKAIK